jgi:hypothetical protein
MYGAVQVIDIILKEFLPSIEHHAMSGSVLIRSADPVFEDQKAVNMAVDILSERGYSVSFDTKVEVGLILVSPAPVCTTNPICISVSQSGWTHAPLRSFPLSHRNTTFLCALLVLISAGL